jgi:hypothetical protein
MIRDFLVLLGDAGFGIQHQDAISQRAMESCER